MKLAIMGIISTSVFITGGMGVWYEWCLFGSRMQRPRLKAALVLAAYIGCVTLGIFMIRHTIDTNWSIIRP